MMTIMNDCDVRTAYNVIRVLNNIGTHTQNAVDEMKRDLRSYLSIETDRRIVKQVDYDGYVELIAFPDCIIDRDEAEMYFWENEHLSAGYYGYDCSGARFTRWFKIFQRGGRYHAYHSVGYDI